MNLMLLPDLSLLPTSFDPGNLNQDLITLPIEAGLILLLNNSYTPRSNALWPFQGEIATATPEPTTLTSSKMAPIAAGVAVATLGGLALTNKNFPAWVQIRGWLHAILLTEVATSGTKVTFQRKRPFYDTELNQYGTASDDSRFSFFSGHASHAFSFATYSSLLLFQYSGSPVTNWIYSTAAFAAATGVAYTRIYDHAHNVSDVVVGGIVGAVISASVFYRVQKVNDEVESKNESLEWKFTPSIAADARQKWWYSGNIEVKF